ncbi:MAG: DNA glycosylase [Candidatus Poribacteria bacterium]|nr:DNA glycosylase [Candidatus Poribacteria bacterium]MDE0506516.1 DNA glycosylase [Candidatus Poribacteria bacterium]
MSLTPHSKDSTIRIHDAADFNLDHTLGSAQSFRWRSHDGWYYGVIEGRLLKIRQTSQMLCIASSADEDPDSLKSSLLHYLDLKRNLPAILREVDADACIHEAIRNFWGMRVLNQELWECLASYIISQNNNVPRIKGIIQTLSARFGDRVILDDYVDYSFPSPESLAEAGIDALLECGTGYRAPYLWEVSASIVADTFNLRNLGEMSYPLAKQELMRLQGIGEKVADCICLFSLGHLEALPVDVWIKRIIEHVYFGRKASIREIREFGESYFGEYIGYAQQYLFHYARTFGLEKMTRIPQR